MCIDMAVDVCVDLFIEVFLQVVSRHAMKECPDVYINISFWKHVKGELSPYVYIY